MGGPHKPGRNPYNHPIGRLRERAQQQLYGNLKKVPGIKNTRLEESGTGIDYQIVGDINTDVFASGVIPVDDAEITVNWWSQSDDDDAWFKFHYWDGTGFDCGWHRQENDHVEGLAHYQERESAEEEYEYEPYSVEEENPIGILWTVVDEELVRKLLDRYDGIDSA